jgi:glycosyltransferase A (GT-A) superfamily protein (DUF2064 family)
MSAVIAILTRSPSDPRLKARIAPVVPNSQQRLDLVLAFLDDLVERVGAMDGVALKVAVTPPLEGLRLARPWIRWDQLLPQRGTTFGDRLRHVFEDLARAGFTQIILLGSDVPDLPSAALEDAVRRLAADPYAVVTGPSGDGSFYLLGLTVHNHVVPELFDKARWGTPHMLEDVEAAAVAHGLTVGRTMDWHDVDTPEDVRELADRVRLAPTTAKATADMLRELKLI